MRNKENLGKFPYACEQHANESLTDDDELLLARIFMQSSQTQNLTPIKQRRHWSMEREKNNKISNHAHAILLLN